VRSKRWLTWLSLLLSFTLLAAACGDDDDEGSTDTSAGDGATGSVFVSGSSTVEPISIRVLELLQDAGTEIDVTVEGPGTGDGFKKFCAGETDISDASRPIKEEEAAECAAADIEFVELKVAFDGISVLTHPDNETVECLSFADLYALMGPESEDFGTWGDAAALAQELGSDTAFPDTDLEISAPGAESGTYDSFVELTLQDIYDERAAAGKAPADVDPPVRRFPGQADDNIIVQGIEGSPSSFGWVGFAFAENAADRVKEIAISEEPGGECVDPTAETIADGSYPVARSLYIYVNAAKAESNAAVAEYVDFYLSDEGMGVAVEESGYVALPDDEIEATRARWDGRETGTAEA
jgi:phosphate transport system substrate-binding protein